jgi:two-component system, chemotaxis family, protein-glutamate methylesterase/glutaminase
VPQESERARKIRVLVVEDSVTVREGLIGALAAEPDIEVVGVAEDGKRAVELCQQARPDVITMDMMLPMMSGLSATEYIMAHCPTPILVVSASINRGELFKIYEALAAGAVDVLEKPTGLEAAGVWQRRFVATVRLVARIRVITHPRARLAGLAARTSQSALPAKPKPGAFLQAGEGTEAAARSYEMVAIGASTGGPGAILDILRSLPEKFRLPILLVLHINEPFGTAFADWLDAQTSRRVVYARDGMAVVAATGRVVVAPGDRHMVVRGGRLHLTNDPERHSCRPSVDALFESVAADYGGRAAACLLTGMGRDGAFGLLKIRQAGGLTMAQDEASSVVYGMPREAALIGAATHILRLDDIGARIAALQDVERRTPAGAAS